MCVSAARRGNRDLALNGHNQP